MICPHALQRSRIVLWSVKPPAARTLVARAATEGSMAMASAVRSAGCPWHETASKWIPEKSMKPRVEKLSTRGFAHQGWERPRGAGVGFAFAPPVRVPRPSVVCESLFGSPLTLAVDISPAALDVRHADLRLEELREYGELDLWAGHVRLKR